jgi:pimeloyl-ACP methyl ester carboxylesterase
MGFVNDMNIHSRAGDQDDHQPNTLWALEIDSAAEVLGRNRITVGLRAMAHRGKRALTRAAAVLFVAVALVAGAISPIRAADAVTTYAGTLGDGATYLIQVPADWNGTLVLYSHGYVAPGSANPALDVGDPLTGQYLLGHGYALAGSSYATTGYAIGEALPDQIATLDEFDRLVGHPAMTIAWGHSLGGIITEGLVQRYPARLDGALPMCGAGAGSAGVWNQGLDGAFVLARLLGAGSGVQLVHIDDPVVNLRIAEELLTAAQATPAGRARIALAAAVAQVPGWFTPTSPEPAVTDYDSQEANEFLWMSLKHRFPSWAQFAFAFRAELEARAGGNPSWNIGVNYARQLERSGQSAEIEALYEEAGLNLDDDLAALAAAPRIEADPSAVAYLTQNIVFDGNLGGLPVLTIHTTADGLVVDQHEQAYRSVVRDAGDSQLLRQAFVHRAGHCTFTPAETIAAFETLVNRVVTGKWAGTADPTALNSVAGALGPTLNVFPAGGTLIPTAPAYLDYEPTPFLRVYDLEG